MMMTTMGLMALTGIGVLGTAACCTLLLHRASASLRHLIWTAALVALIALPAFEVSGLRVEIPVPAAVLNVLPMDAPTMGVRPGRDEARKGSAIARTPSDEGAHASSVTTGRARAATASPVPSQTPTARASTTGIPAAGPGSASPADADEETLRARVARDILTLRSGSTPDVRASQSGLDVRVDEGAEPEAFSDRTGTALRGVRPGSALVVLWAIGAIGLLAWTLLGHGGAYRLVSRDVERASPSAARRFAALCLELGVRRPVKLVVSSTVDVPATWGLTRSTVVLPTQYERWSPATLDRVLLHELAHVRRGDCRTYLVGEVARALHWPNPLVWYALSRQRAESERACDDLVLARGDAPSSYAQDLVALVRQLRLGHPVPPAILTMTEPSGLGRRVRAILDPEQARGAVGSGVVLGSTIAAVVAAFAMTALAPVASAQTSDETPATAAAFATAMEPGAAHPVEPAPLVPVEPTPVPRVEPLVAMDPPPVVDLREPPAWSAPDYHAPAILEAPVTWVMSDWESGLPSGSGVDGDGAIGQSGELCVFGPDGPRSTSMNVNDDEIRIRWETDDCRVDVRIEGDVAFLDDDSGIARMGGGSRLEIEERIGRTDRRIRMEGRSDGVERRYWVDGEEVAWSQEADQWLAALLPQVFRHTTINAEARVRRMIAEGGPDRVFEEVREIRSDHVATRYLELLMEYGSLDEEEYARVIDYAGEIESDHSAGELLLAVVERAGLRPAFQEPMLRAAEGLESDHQKGRVLDALLESDLTTAQLDAVVASTRSIESDHTLASVLTTVAAKNRLGAMDRQSFLDALVSIDSDHSKGMVLDAFLDAGPLSDEEVVRVLELSESIGSDHQRASILQRIADEYPLDGAQADAYLRSASLLESDHQIAVTAGSILENGPVDGDQLAVVLAMADRVESDHQRATVLVGVIENVDLTSAEVAEVLRVTRGLSSDHQLAETLVRLIEDEELADADVADVLALCDQIGSDHERASVMTTLAGRYTISGDALRLYRDLAEDMSRHQRDQALAALAR